jgi:hypothetical protein
VPSKSGTLGHKFELVRGLIARDHLPGAVEDQTARGRDRLGAHAVALGAFRVVGVPAHLQHVQARDQAEGRKRHDHRADDRALIEEALLAPVILDAYRRHGSVRQSGPERLSAFTCAGPLHRQG